MKLIIDSAHTLLSSGSKKDSHLRVRRYRIEGAEDQPLDIQLGFPEQDAVKLMYASSTYQSVDVCFLAALTPRPVIRADEVFEDETQVPQVPRPWLILARVIANYEAENKEVRRTHMEGFTCYSSMCVTDSRTTVPHTSGAAGTNMIATPGRVGVYVADHIGQSFGNKPEAVHPLNGWVSNHPRKAHLLRLEAVNDLFDLDYFRRAVPHDPIAVAKRIDQQSGAFK